MKNLLLPYGKDINGHLIKIEDAHKEQKYTCPECGAELSMIISKKQEGEKYYRRPHFAHKGTTDNHCSETFLHRLFKEKVVAFVQQKIDQKENCNFEWNCDKCGESHKGNLLKKAVRVEAEYNLGTCQPDVALLDATGKVIIVIEVVVTHKPEPEVLQYYDEQKIACLEIEVEDFSDCNRIEEKLAHPTRVNMCSNPKCSVCHKPMNKVQLVIRMAVCWKCHHPMKIALLETENSQHIIRPSEFTREDIELARQHGVKIECKFSSETKKSYYANVCTHCNMFMGDNYLHEYYYERQVEKIDAGYKCFACIENEKTQIYLKEREDEEKETIRINKIISQAGDKRCPLCDGRLRIRKGTRGLFWGCQNYPTCKYTEPVEDID